MLGLHFCARAFSSCGKRGPLFIAVHGPLTVAASLVAEHRLQTRRLSSCGSRVQLLRGMWNLPRPGLEPVSPASAGRFSTTGAVFLKEEGRGLPWWCSGWESACQCRGHGFEPWSGKIPHAADQLGPWATTTESAHLEPVLRNRRGHDSERPAHRDEEWPPLAATGGGPRTETKTQHSQK